MVPPHGLRIDTDQDAGPALRDRMSASTDLLQTAMSDGLQPARGAAWPVASAPTWPRRPRGPARWPKVLPAACRRLHGGGLPGAWAAPRASHPARYHSAPFRTAQMGPASVSGRRHCLSQSDRRFSHRPASSGQDGRRKLHQQVSSSRPHLAIDLKRSKTIMLCNAGLAPCEFTSDRKLSCGIWRRSFVILFSSPF